MTQPFEFEEPVAQGDRFTAEEAQNRRLIVVPTEYVPQIRTARGDIVDAVRLNVVDLDNQGNTYWGALWFGNKLIQTFKPKLGKLFLGYVNKQQVGGGFSAWIFTSLTADQATTGMAQQFLANNPKFMETCQGDVRMAQTQRAAWPAQQQAQPQGQWQQSQSQPGGPPPWQSNGPAAGPRQAPLPPPVTPPLPPVQLPPQTEADPWPAQSMPPGNGQPSAPPAQAPGSPAPVGGSVMERLRAQRDQGYAQGPAQEQTPF